MRRVTSRVGIVLLAVALMSGVAGAAPAAPKAP